MRAWSSLLLLAALNLVTSASAALPEGFDEELYCPKDTCLHERERPAGFTGPRVAFHQCVNTVSGEVLSSPRPWGHKFNEHYKAQLLKDGYHTTTCPKELQVKARSAAGGPRLDPREEMDHRRAMHEREIEMMRSRARGMPGSMDRDMPYPEDGMDDEHKRRMMERSEEMMRENPVYKAGQDLRARHERRDAERRREFEERREKHLKMHEERMQMLKEKHPEHYERMESRRKQLEEERSERIWSKIDEKADVKPRDAPQEAPKGEAKAEAVKE